MFLFAYCYVLHDLTCFINLFFSFSGALFSVFYLISLCVTQGHKHLLVGFLLQ